MGRRPLSETEKRTRREFGSRLKQLRMDRSLSLNEAARRSGIDHTRLSRIESGTRPSTIAVRIALARVYDTAWEALEMMSPAMQVPSVMPASILDEAQQQERRDEYFGENVTEEERWELEVYLGYLRFRGRLSGADTSRPRASKA